MGQAVEPLGGRILLRIGGVDAIDIGRLEDRLCADLGGAQHRRGVGREERIAGSTAEQYDSALGEVFVRYALGEGIEKQETDFAAEVAAASGKK